MPWSARSARARRSRPSTSAAGRRRCSPRSSIAAILDLVRARFGIADGAEVTIESNPGPDERGDARALVAAGVNRVSLGAQAFDPVLLRRLGRRHRAGDVADAVREARDAGIGSVSVDLLYDVPGQDVDAWSDALEDGDRAGRGPRVRVRPHPRRPGRGGDHRPARRSPADTLGGAALARDGDPRAGRGHGRGPVRARGGPPRRRRLSRLRDLELGPARAREPPQPRLLAAPSVRGRRSRGARVRRCRAALECRPPGRIPAGTRTRGCRGVRPSRPAAPRPWTPPRRQRRPSSSGSASTTGLPSAEARTGPLAPHLDWALATGLLREDDGPDGSRVRLTTAGRLLSNELFARLV